MLLVKFDSLLDAYSDDQTNDPVYERRFMIVESFDDEEVFTETNNRKQLKSITEVLSSSYNSEGERSLNIVMKRNDGARFLQLFLTNMLYAG